MESPLISVVLPVYNAERYLVSAVQSIRAQTFGDWELIAVDDGSTDKSLSILEKLAADDSRIRICSRPNTGIVGALNDGISLARGKYIARMDSDDLSLPERFALQVAHLEANPRCALLGTMVLRVDPEGLPIGPEVQPCDHDSIMAKLIEGAAGTVTHPSIMIRKESLAAIGGYRVEYQWVEDYDLFLRMAMQGAIENLPETLLHYRLHHDSVNMKKRSVQGVLAAQCLTEACARLGIPNREPTAMLDWLAKPLDPVSTRRGWARRALACGYFSTARKHAWANLIAQPWKPSWWKLLVLASLKTPTVRFRSRFRWMARSPELGATP